MDEMLNQPWASALIPFLRAFIRFTPPSSIREKLWLGYVDPYLAWRDHRFVASTLAGRLAGTTSDILQQYLYYFGTWEPHVTAFLRSRLRPGDGFLDVGSNIGYFSLLAARCVGPTGCVVSVEASPQNFALLSANIARNRAAIRALNCAASDKPGWLKIFAGDDGNCGACTIAGNPDTQAHAEVEAAPLDALLKPDEAAKIRLVKIDVEGAEAAVVAGMSSLLANCRQDCEFLIEIHPEMLARLDRTVDDVLMPFQNAGFHAYCIENDYDASAYLWPGTLQKPRRLKEPIEYDINVLFSRTDADEL